MTLSQRLIAGLLTVVGALVAAVALFAGGRLDDRLSRETSATLASEARLVGSLWTERGNNPDSLADTLADALGRRITLLDSAGRTLGDSEFEGEALRRLERPAEGTGLSVTIAHPRGLVRVASRPGSVERIIRDTRRDIVVASLMTLILAVILAVVFSQRVSRPIVELRDVTRAIASGDLTRRPPLTAPGEVGDLAASVSRMTDELGRRLQEMEDEDGRLVAIIESLDEAIVAVDARGDVVRMNDVARRLFAAGESLPFPSARLPLGNTLRQAIAAAAEGTVSAGVETGIGDRIVAVTARPLPAGGAVLAVMDLTERRRLETVRRDFVANVSHELKTPLTVISGFAETLRDPQLNDADRERFIDLLTANTTRMQRIVDDLLDLSRYESNAWTPRPAEVDLEHTVSELFTLFRPAAAKKGLTLAGEVAPEARLFRFDPTALRQILANLVENAIRYTTSGSITVTVRRPADGEVEIAVADTGIGIPPEHLSRIFERFYRADPSRSRSDGGTGLGLAIVRHLVEAHGGRVAAESRVGDGTTVFVRLPA